MTSAGLTVEGQWSFRTVMVRVRNLTDGCDEEEVCGLRGRHDAFVVS